MELVNVLAVFCVINEGLCYGMSCYVMSLETPNCMSPHQHNAAEKKKILLILFHRYKTKGNPEVFLQGHSEDIRNSEKSENIFF